MVSFKMVSFKMVSFKMVSFKMVSFKMGQIKLNVNCDRCVTNLTHSSYRISRHIRRMTSIMVCRHHSWQASRQKHVAATTLVTPVPAQPWGSWELCTHTADAQHLMLTADQGGKWPLYWGRLVEANQEIARERSRGEDE
ncbi:uncharacterized protein [Cherax quadricarinatus]|uniref:uncharacterized protein n=1 Tax=Cherax quadricarinatus TaxID=27406 RepID=UPI00387E9360